MAASTLRSGSGLFTCRSTTFKYVIASSLSASLNQLDPPTGQQITDWRAIIGFRNVLIHGYAVVQHDKTWDVVTSELPVLLREVTAMLATPPDGPTT